MNGGEESIPSGQASTNAQVTVLIVEDHFWTRYMAAEYLRGSGYRVIEANNADEALSVLASANRVDVVFSDIQMSGSMDGLALADWIAQRFPRLPVILTSGRRPAVLPANCRRFFVKPCSLADVEREIRALAPSSTAGSAGQSP
jgi:two-component system, response regulator PdtaR